jgi:transposase
MPRAKRPELSPQLRGRILELRDLGWSLARIAQKHELPKSTVQYTVAQGNERAARNQASKPRIGAPRVISEDQRDAIVEALNATPSITHLALQQQEALNASVDTIRRLLREMNMRKWIRLKRPALTEAHA